MTYKRWMNNEAILEKGYTSTVEELEEDVR